MIAGVCTREVVTASEDETVLAVARRMATHDVGTVVVVTKLMQPVGIVTDRDIVERIVSIELDPARTPVSVIMTRELRCVDESTPIGKALGIMACDRVRRLVVTGEAFQLRGIASLDDLLALMASEAETVGRIAGAARARRPPGRSGPPDEIRSGT